jgi:L-ascorbate metabolism protein UlaG (beta-lactamase superfamily)
LVPNKADAIKTFYSIELLDNDNVFIYLGYSGILLRTNKYSIAIDPGKSLSQPEISVMEHLDFLLFTHDHWDHYNHKIALEIIKQTGAHVIADVVSSEDLKVDVISDKLTVGKSGTNSTTYRISDFEVIALRGVHVGPISQYLIDLGGIKVFHGGDSGYWRQIGLNADMMFVPVGTARTCSPAVALASVIDYHPKVAIPMHGKKQEMKKFKHLMEKILPEVEAIIPEKFKPVKYTF